MEWMENAPEWLKGILYIVGTAGGVAITYAVSKLGMGHGKEIAKEEAKKGTFNHESAANSQIVGIGGVLLERSTAERMIDVAGRLTGEVHGLTEVMKLMVIAYDRMADRMEDAEKRLRIKEEFEQENEMRRLREELRQMREGRP